MQFKTLSFAIAIITLSILITSCKKEKDEDTIVPFSKTCLLDYSVDKENGDSNQFFYDAENRLNRLEYYLSDKKLRSFSTYTYLKNKVVYNSIFYNEGDASNVENEIHYHLNAEGLVNIKSQKRDYGFNMNYDSSFYTYDAEGYNTRLIEKEISQNDGVTAYSNTDTTWYVYANGNIVTEKLKKQNGTVKVTTYTYTTLKDKSKFFSSPTTNPGMFGKGNENLPATQVNNENSDSETYTYVLNDNGLISSFKIVKTYDGDTYIEDLHTYYTCK